MIFRYMIKSLFKNRMIWFWGIFYVSFWLILGVFVWSNGMEINYLKDYAATWYAFDSIISISSISVSLSYSIYFSSTSLSYLFKNSRLSSYEYYIESIISIAIFFIIVGILLGLIEILLFKIKFNIWIIPSNIPFLIILLFISGLIFYSFSIVMVILINNYAGLKNINFVSFVPMLLGWLFGYSVIFFKMPNYVIYSNFITPLAYAFVNVFLNHQVYVELSNPNSGIVNIQFCALSIFIWLIVLIIGSIYLLKRIRAKNIEEAMVI